MPGHILQHRRIHTQVRTKPPFNLPVDGIYVCPIDPNYILGVPTAAWLFNEGAGSTAHDLASSGKYNFTIPSSNVTWKTSSQGVVIDRDNAANANRLTAAKAITTGTTFSIATRLFIRGISAGAYGNILTVNANQGLYIRKPSASLFVNYYTSGDNNGATAIAANMWTDIVVSVSSGAMKYFINGIADANTFTSIGSFALNTSLSDSGIEYLDCQLAHLYVWVGAAIGQQGATLLLNDPYGMFVLPKRRVISAPAAAAASKVPWHLFRRMAA